MPPVPSASAHTQAPQTQREEHKPALSLYLKKDNRNHWGPDSGTRCPAPQHSQRLLGTLDSSQTWCHQPTTPAPGQSRRGRGSQVRGYPGLPRELPKGLGYRARTCLPKTNINQPKNYHLDGVTFK